MSLDKKKLKVAVLAGLACALIAVFASGSGAQQRHIVEQREWKMFGGGPENIHYSSLRQINRENVNKLEVAWTYDTNDAFDGSEMQCNPVIADGVLYATSPKLRVIALDAATGNVRWSFDPNEGKKPLGKVRNRGVTYWESDNGDKRIYFAFRHLLYALDAKTGQMVNSFGQSGRVDLREGLGRDPKDMTITVSTPGVVYKDMLIVGSLVSEELPAAPGYIRAFDLRTGSYSAPLMPSVGSSRGLAAC